MRSLLAWIDRAEGESGSSRSRPRLPLLQRLGTWLVLFMAATFLGCSDPITQGPQNGGDDGEPILDGCDSVVVVCCACNDSAGVGDPPVFPMHHRDPDWSQQGLIAYEDLGIVCVDSCSFYRIDPSLAGIWILDPETGEKRWLTPGGAPSWSPDGTKIAFELERQIYTINADGTGLVQLTRSGRNFFPAWSPDGETVAYHSNAGGGGIWLMGFEGTNMRKISTGAYPDWSPDGMRIVAIQWPVPGGEVNTMDVDGSNPIRVTHNDADDRAPAYSPDGQWIAFGSQSHSSPRIWIIRPDGTEARQLTSHAGSHPTWSPDGTKIVYYRENWGCDIPENGVLWIVDVATGEETQLTFKWPERCGLSSYSLRNLPLPEPVRRTPPPPRRPEAGRDSS